MGKAAQHTPLPPAYLGSPSDQSLDQPRAPAHTSTRPMPSTPRASPTTAFGPSLSPKKRLARTATVSGWRQRPTVECRRRLNRLPPPPQGVGSTIQKPVTTPSGTVSQSRQSVFSQSPRHLWAPGDISRQCGGAGGESFRRLRDCLDVSPINPASPMSPCCSERNKRWHPGGAWTTCWQPALVEPSLWGWR